MSESLRWAVSSRDALRWRRRPGPAAVGRSAPGPSGGEDVTIEMLELPREECLRLLASHSFGRLAVSMGERAPVLRPVNYLFDDASQSVVFRTAVGSGFPPCCGQSRAHSRSTASRSTHALVGA